MRNSTFLLKFQEKVAKKKSTNNKQPLKRLQAGTKTMTFTREERDQDESALSLGTRTITETREESDQDLTNSTLTLGTRTQTRTREESDQDFSNTQYTALPRC